MDYKLASKEFFDTLEVEAEAAVVQSLALEQGINFYYPSEGSVRMSFDEVTTPAEIEAVAGIFAAAKGKKAKAVKAVAELHPGRPAARVRLPPGAGLQRLPFGKRPDALYQKTGTEETFRWPAR